jgi:hypothetical protein
VAGRVRVKGPDGSAWTVRRRWYPWRPALLLKALWHSIPDGGKRATPGESKASENHVESAIVLILWPVQQLIEFGRFLLLILVVVVSLVDLVFQLLMMPFVLLARTVGVMRWPVQIDREKRYFRTEHALGFGAAAALRDDIARRIQRGALEPGAAPST